MKTLILITLFFIFTIPLFAGDVDTLVNKTVYRDTLTATKDTVDISFRNDSWGLNRFTILAYTTTGTDTVQVSLTGADGTTFAQQGITDLSDKSDDAQIIVTTTPKEFLIWDTNPVKIRLICPDASASCIVIVGGKSVRW